ncbi:hypothetical protein CAPTEDRAFT_209196 [Capitella teleta]|uniref:Uncharacterized protein n=1 Tax=Capitella teleta TaxID=283909 RepID=R7VMD3_CAPTE|nr:hypothetical protein CAPTEDRAFT_209196 [Capitella teleta]|eukprot:ELU18640.1 hypothetical protein CAPTEDRAFT_209196 [Capitella teleta]
MAAILPARRAYSHDRYDHCLAPENVQLEVLCWLPPPAANVHNVIKEKYPHCHNVIIWTPRVLPPFNDRAVSSHRDIGQDRLRSSFGNEAFYGGTDNDQDEYWINKDDDKEPDSDDDCDCDLELLRPPAVTTLGLLSQATIKTWMIIEGTVSTGQCDTLKIEIAFSADGSNCLLRLIARQFSSDARSDSDENDNGTPPPFPPPPPPLPPPPSLPQENQI